MKRPIFTHRDIEFIDGPKTYMRAQGLFQKGLVVNIQEGHNGYIADVQGTELYDVFIMCSAVDRGSCTCYLGEQDILCKHMLALGLAVLDEAGVKPIEFDNTSLDDVKLGVTEGMSYIKAYSGPSRTWFNYTANLARGSSMIYSAVESLEPTKINVKYLWSLVKRIDQKISRGVDDSDGAVGECVHKIVALIASWAKEDEALLIIIREFTMDKTNFCWEDDLKSLL